MSAHSSTGFGALPTAELALNTMLISEGIYLSERLGCKVSVDDRRIPHV